MNEIPNINVNGNTVTNIPSNTNNIINTNGITNIPNNTNQAPKIGIVDGPSVISTIDPPVTKTSSPSVIRSLEAPVFRFQDPSFKYPVISLPLQPTIDAVTKKTEEKKKQEKEEEEEKSRKLSDTTPPPQLPRVFQTPPIPAVPMAVSKETTPIVEVPVTNNPTFEIAGVKVDLPDPSLVATAGSVAVVTTAATMISGIALNALKNAVEPMIREATKNKFKIKLKQVKPVLHYVLTEENRIDIFQYSVDGTKLIDTTDSVENYIRAQVETNAFYETENVIIIDDVISNKFTKEGQKRFKSFFAPAKKIAKKLSARLSF